jgi:formate hydrogenlyase subunit 3/multisubunit Na+/H+ antiporter MnhD subunit
MSLVVLPVVLPLLAAFLLQPLESVSRRLARLLGPAVLVVCVAILARTWSVFGEAAFTVALGGFAPPVGIVFYVDRLALLFALAVPTLGLLFWPYAAAEGRVRIDALMLLLLGSSTGLALSGDLFNLYVFYELATVASFGLAAASGTGRAYLATVRYLLISGLGSVLGLVGIAVVYAKTGTLNLAHLAQLGPEQLNDPVGLAAFASLLIGFGVKGELFPLNVWVPEVYATAPKRVVALLAGLVSKLAVLVVARLLVLVFPQPEAQQLVLALGVLGLITGELAAWHARDFPRLLAFSSIGQLGLVFIAFGVPGDAGVLAGIAVALHHLLVKPALFALADGWSGSVERLTGAAWRAPLAAALFVLFALSLIGVPPLPGFWTKLLVLSGLAAQGQAIHLLAFGAILMVTILEASYLFRVAAVLFSARPEAAAAQPPARLEASTATVLGAALLAATVAAVPLGDWLREIARQATDTSAYVSTVLPTSFEGRLMP